MHGARRIVLLTLLAAVVGAGVVALWVVATDAANADSWLLSMLVIGLGALGTMILLTGPAERRAARVASGVGLAAAAVAVGGAIVLIWHWVSIPDAENVPLTAALVAVIALQVSLVERRALVRPVGRGFVGLVHGVGFVFGVVMIGAVYDIPDDDRAFRVVTSGATILDAMLLSAFVIVGALNGRSAALRPQTLARLRTEASERETTPDALLSTALDALPTLARSGAGEVSTSS